MGAYNIIVLSKPVAGREAEFDAWYTAQHIQDLLKVPGITSAQRFRIRESQSKGTPHQFIARYEVETDDIDKTLAEVQERLGTDAMPMSDAFDMASATFLVAEAITEKLTAARDAPTILRCGV
jgi:hypothetical protein